MSGSTTVQNHADIVARELTLLSRASRELSELLPQEDIYQAIGRRLHELAPKAVIWISSIDEASERFILRSLMGLGPHFETIVRILGRSPIGLSSFINSAAKQGLTRGRLEMVPGGLYEVGVGILTQSVCMAIEKLLGLGDLYGMGLVWRGQLFGSVIIALRAGGVLENAPLMEALITQSSVALQRWHAEVALIKAKTDGGRQIEEGTSVLTDDNRQLKPDNIELRRVEEERFRSLIENASDAIFIVGEDGMVNYTSPATERLLGYRPEELIGNPTISLAHPDDAQNVTGLLAQLKEEPGAIVRAEVRAKHKDGSWRHVVIMVQNCLSDPAVAGIAINVRDITERKHWEQLLMASEERYRVLVENANDAIVVAQDGMLKFFNAKAVEITGYSKEELASKAFIELIHPEDRAMVMERHQKRLQGDDFTHAYPFRTIDRHGKVKWMRINAVFISWEGCPATLNFISDITEQKLAEEELRKSADRSRRFIHSAPDIIFRWSVDKGVEYVSPSALRITGFNAVDLLGYTTLEAEIARAVRLHKEEDLKDMASRGINLPSSEFAFRCSDGREAHLEIRAVPVIDGAGNLAAIEGILRDITERKRAEEELRRSEQFSATLLTNCPTPILVVNPDASVRYVNRAVEELTGYSASELVGAEPPYPWWTDETLEDTGRDLADAITRGAQGLEQLCKKKSGERFWIELTSTPIVRDSEVTYYLVNWVDVTERKRAEEALRSSEHEYRMAIESARDGIVIIDSRGIVVDANRTFVKGLGFDYKEQIIGRRISDIVSIQESEKKIQESIDVVRTRGYIANVQVSVRTKDGREVPVEINITQRYDPKGREAGGILLIRDITERKRAEMEVLRYAHRLEALHAISAVVSQSRNIDEMLNAALKKVLEVMGTDAGYIHLFDRENKELVLKAHHGVSEQYTDIIRRIQVSEEAMQRWHQYPEPAFKLKTILSSEEARKTIEGIRDREGLAANVAVPLWSKAVMHGGLTLANRTRRRFSSEELELLKAIGNEIALGIENAMLIERMRSLSVTDELTRLYNRRHFYEVLEVEIDRARRYGGSFTLAMIDLDDFKEFNDRCGHASGDVMLQSMARVMKSQLRKPDMAFRFGADEFAIILPETQAADARGIIDRIRTSRLEAVKGDNETFEKVMCFSAGIVEFPENAETADGLVFLSDTALYRAKRAGGNRSVLVSELGELTPDIVDGATMEQVYALAATVDARDPHTYGHSKRVASISEMIGRALGIPPRELTELRAAALLHDIGKVGVPDAILTKPGRPDDREWKIIRKHPLEGAKIVGHVTELRSLVPIIRHHHEWYDGSGYPDGLKGMDIPLAARIVAVADAFDTMTTTRPYRHTVSDQKACDELIRCASTQFDSRIVEAFCKVLKEMNRSAVGKGISPGL